MAEDVQLLLTENIKNNFNALPTLYQDDLFKHVKYVSQGTRDVQVLPYSQLVKIFHDVRKTNPKKKLYLHEFLAGSCIYEKPPKISEKSPELIKRLKKLQSEVDQKEYDGMIKNISQKKNTSAGEDFGAAVRSTSQQMISVFNLLLTVFGCAFFAFFASQYAWENLGLRVIFAVIVGCIVAIADLYFLARIEI